MDEPLLQHALSLRRAGRLAEAAALYSDILAREPRHFEALHSLGILRYQGGQLEEAERLIGEAVSVRPGAADALYNRASLLQRMNRLDEALQVFGAAIAAKPDYIEALTNRGVLLTRFARFPEALADFDRVVALKPGFAQAWRNRAMALEALGRLDELAVCLERLVRLEPNDAMTLLKRADLLLHLNRAAEAEAAFGQYLAGVPGDAAAWNRRGIANAELKRKDEAIAAFGKAVELDPGNADYRNNRATALFEAKRFEEAAADYEKALSIAPDLPYAEGYLLQCRLRACDWRDLDIRQIRIAGSLAAGRQAIDPLSNLAISTSPAEQLECARIWIADGRQAIEPALWQGEIYRHDRIRVAYLSADYRFHPVAYLMAGVFEHHDHERFEIVGVSSTPTGENAMRTHIERACSQFYDVRDKTDQYIAALLRRLEIDIAVDLTGFTDGARTGVLARRPAPVQVNYLGYPGTMGAPYVDYIVADRTVIPESEQRHYAERVAYLPGCYLPADSKRRIADKRPTRAEQGLPAHGIVFASFNDTYKIAPETFEVWMRVLRQIDGSVLWLAQGNPAAVANLKREAAARGVAPERLVFAAYAPAMEDHLARLSLADLVLDTLPYNAHASASDALWAGVPVLTCAGTSFAGRVAASALKAAGLSETITRSSAEYEALALKLAREPQSIAVLKEKLAQTRTTCALFDTARFTRALESAYRTMWQRTQIGAGPETFSVEP